MQLHLDDLAGTFGLGVAGNFAGHLEQAGEAADFASVTAGPGEAPKGIFPWYAPGSDTFLGTFPLSHDRLVLPASDAPVNAQIEPEAGVLCTVGYGPDGRVASLHPQWLAAFDDCSVRREGAPKISHKKNWGPYSKGVAATAILVTDLEADGPTATLRLACFLRRGELTAPYGVDSPLAGYSYYGRRLLDWIVDRLNHQTGGASTPLEDVGALLRAAGSPPTVLVGIGATRYTPLGETTYLQAGDEALVVVYDGARCSPDQLLDAVRAGDEDTVPGASVLCQTVGEPASA